MKKVIVLLCYLISTILVNAQEAKNGKMPYDYYCVYYGQQQIIGKIKPLRLIWGDQKEEVKLTNPNGEEVKFKNMVDVTNYLSKRGWKCVDTENYRDIFYIVFVKTVYSDQEAKEGLYFNTDFK